MRAVCLNCGRQFKYVREKDGWPMTGWLHVPEFLLRCAIPRRADLTPMDADSGLLVVEDERRGGLA